MENLGTWRMLQEEINLEKNNELVLKNNILQYINYPEKPQSLLQRFFYYSVPVDKYLLEEEFELSKKRFRRDQNYTALIFFQTILYRIFPVRKTINNDTIFVFQYKKEWWYWHTYSEEPRLCKDVKNDVENNENFYFNTDFLVNPCWDAIRIKRIQRQVKKWLEKRKSNLKIVDVKSVHTNVLSDMIDLYLEQKQKVKQFKKDLLREMNYPTRKELFDRRIRLTSIPVEKDVLERLVARLIHYYDADDREIFRKSYPVRMKTVDPDDFYLFYQGTWWCWDSVKISQIPFKMSEDFIDYIDEYEDDIRTEGSSNEMKLMVQQCWKHICIKRIQRTVRVWLGSVNYRSGNQGFVYRKAFSEFNSCMTTTDSM